METDHPCEAQMTATAYAAWRALRKLRMVLFVGSEPSKVTGSARECQMLVTLRPCADATAVYPS